jgi:hypothetical protein
MNRIDALLVQAVVLLDRQYLLIDHLIETRGHALREFERAIEKKQQALNHVLDVYNYIFALIDHLVRYEKIAYTLPRLNHKASQYRELGRAMDDLKSIRHQFQHVNNDIENNNTGPLLGSVCWVSGQQQFIASFHDIGRPRSSPGIILDTSTGTFAQQFSYIYNDRYYDLDRAIEGVRTFNKFANSQVRVEVDGKLYDPKDHFMAVRLEFQIPQKLGSGK